jgi:hypothetical protein
LKSLWAPNQHFAELFVFNGLTAFSFRAVAASGCHARDSGRPGGLSRHLNSRLRGNDKRAGSPPQESLRKQVGHEASVLGDSPSYLVIQKMYIYFAYFFFNAMSA